MSTPYSGLRYWEQLGYLAAKDSYNYDDNIPAYKLKTGREQTILEYERAEKGAFDRIKRVRSRPYVRGDIRLSNGQTMKYHSSDSADSISVYTTEDTLVLGFRGTDPGDPVRFMNWIPSASAAKSKGLPGFDEQCKKVFLSMLPAKKKTREVLDEVDRFYWGSEEFNQLIYRLGGALVEREKFGTPQCPDPCSNTCNPTMTKETIQNKVCGMYCSFPLSSPNLQKVKGVYWNIYQYDTSLEGGENRAQENSDCNSDRQIVLATSTPERMSVLRRDPKHKATAKWAIDVIDKLLVGKRKNVIFAGHSLGGSLAFHAYVSALEYKNSDEEYFYVGFNAASLGNYDSVRRSLDRYDKTWRFKCAAHRIDTDAVSLDYGKLIPTVTYGSKFGALPVSIDFWVHGIYVFQTCPLEINTLKSQGYLKYINPYTFSK